jgi:membrane fusion protein (multidrug efflux system)
VAEEKELEQLRDEIHRLSDEQERLRSDQEQLRREREPESNGNSDRQQQEIQDQPPVQTDQEKSGATQTQPENNASLQQNRVQNQTVVEQEEKEKIERKPPLRERIGNYVRTHRKGLLLAAAAFLVLVVAGIFLLMYLSSYESTDDAQVDGHLNSINPRIAGTVTGAYVENNQSANAGELLVDLDPRDYEMALQQARASYAQAEAQLKAEHPNIPIVETTNQTLISTSQADVAVAEAAVAATEQDYQARLANLREAEANNAKAQTDLKRYEYLVQKEEVSRQQYDSVVANAKTQAASVEAAQAAAKAAEKAIDQSRAQLLQAQSRLQQASQNAPRSVAIREAEVASRQANLLAARAQADQAALNLSYTKIYAPVRGIVSEKSVEVGQHVQPGEQMLVISQIDDVWVTANFKETQLKNMRAGQPADIHVDAYNTTYRGYVENMPGATGAVTSLLPPQNATGNYVKVVQRMPVRIRLNDGQDPQRRLRPGMSVEPKVWLK